MRVSITEHNVVQHIKERNERAIPFMIQTYGGLLQVIDPNKNTFKQWIAAIAKYRAIDYQRKMIKNQQRFVLFIMIHSCPPSFIVIYF